MEKQAFIQLIEKYLAGQALPSEEQLLLNYYESFQANAQWDEVSLGSKANMEMQLLQRLQASIQSSHFTRPAHRVHFLKTTWFRYAAIILLIVGASIYYYFNLDHSQFNNNKKPLAHQSGTTNITNRNKAILTLASGKKIELDNHTNGRLLQPDGVEVTTPKGAQYHLILPDGTKAWLNAASSIRFPSAFTGNERRVEVTGEIYFEVAVNKTAPFVVTTKGMEVQVLGTSFNINAYEDENTLKTSLLEGAIKVNNKIIAPGQAYLNGKVITTDIEQDIAWKNGLFNFNHFTLQQVMNQVAKWYDVEIVYEGELPPFEFYGKIGRDLSLDQLIKGLSGLWGLNLRVEGKKLIVSK